MNSAIILAGGLSERLSSLSVPKQFYEVEGMPVLIYSLRSFESCEDIANIVVVSSSNWWKRISLWGLKYNISKLKIFAVAGKTRQHSIYNGLLSLENVKSSDKIRIVIHDASRPLVNANDISESIYKVDGYEGATPYIKANETLYISSSGIAIDGLLDRDKLYIGQTPECYNFKKYLKAHHLVGMENLSKFHGSSEIAFKSNLPIHLFPGRQNNIKITTLDDLKYFEYLMRENEY
jgi:2-C-methyl-D-erythritol 4-phosphate cytidylyltransferase